MPAFLVGIVFGPVGARFLDTSKWGSNDSGDGSEVAYVCFLSRVIGHRR